MIKAINLGILAAVLTPIVIYNCWKYGVKSKQQYLEDNYIEL